MFNRGTGEVKFCDIDGSQVDELEMDIYPFRLLEYLETRRIDKGVHPYMHNIMTLRAFELDLYCSSKSDVKKVFERHANSIIKSMRDPREFNDEHIVTYMKKYK